MDRRLHLVGFADRAAEPVREPTAAESDAPVRRPLGVDELVVLVGDRRASGPADLLPDVGREGLGGEHVRSEGEVAAALAG